MSKPFVALAAGGWGADPQAYIDSGYAMISQAMGAVFGFAVALLTLVVFTRDMLRAATERSETDTLSGLLNRRGFEGRAANALQDADRRSMPISLVICDIDHFKSINDSFGHAGGDRVIAALAGFLSSTVRSHHAAGRIGGEEFAIVLPDADLAAARLFAEGARSAFAALAIDGLPAGRRFTASFGVAERRPGEGFSELLARADAALYVAKKEGRDRVRVDTPTAATLAQLRTG
jgi:diguanylate cyclase (GGDEF)-like protein